MTKPRGAATYPSPPARQKCARTPCSSASRARRPAAATSVPLQCAASPACRRTCDAARGWWQRAPFSSHASPATGGRSSASSPLRRRHWPCCLPRRSSTCEWLQCARSLLACASRHCPRWSSGLVWRTRTRRGRLLSWREAAFPLMGSCNATPAATSTARRPAAAVAVVTGRRTTTTRSVRPGARRRRTTRTAAAILRPPALAPAGMPSFEPLPPRRRTDSSGTASRAGDAARSCGAGASPTDAPCLATWAFAMTAISRRRAGPQTALTQHRRRPALHRPLHCSAVQ